MKKLAKLLAAGVLSAGMFGGVAAAQQTTTNCTITGTGANSVNTCTVDTSNIVTVTCTNTITATNINVQNAVSGSTNVSGNTISGEATSGSANNINNLVNELAQICAAAAPVTPPTPPNGGQGGGEVAAAQTPVKALPKTGELSAVATAAIATAAVVAIAGASQVAVSAYRRSQN